MVYPNIAGAVEAKAMLTAQAVTSTTAVNGTAIDMSAYEGNALIVVNAGAASTGDTLGFAVQESVDNSTWAAVPADALFNVATGANATLSDVTDAGASFQTVGLRKERVARYVRLVATATGTSISIVVGAQLIGAKKYA